MNFALVKSIKRVLKSTTIFGRDVSEEDNVNLFFSSGIFWTFLTAVREVRNANNLAALMTIKMT